MNVEARGALVGMVLGDGTINVTNGKRELCVAHGLQQRDYCEHKAARVRQILGGQFTVREYANGPSGAYRCVKFCSSHAYWSTLRSLLYPNGRKTFTRRALDMLTDEGIALWYMDDGHARVWVNSNGWVSSVSTDIATMCSKAECLVIAEYFREVHQIEWAIRCRKTSADDRAFYLSCNTTNSREFANLVRPYIIPSMLYKLSHVADLDSHECRTPIGKCAACGAPIYQQIGRGLCGTCRSRRYYREVRRFAEGRKPRLVGDEIVRPSANTEALEVVDKEPPR